MQSPCRYCTEHSCTGCICYKCKQPHCFAVKPSDCVYASKSILKRETDDEEVPETFDLTNVSMPISMEPSETSPDMLQGVSNNFQLAPINDSKGSYD